MNKIIEKIKGDTWYVLNKKTSIRCNYINYFNQFWKLAFPAYIYICYTNLLPNNSLALMIFATALIILIVVITSLEDLRQNILRKEKQIVAAEERTKDCEKYLSKKVNKSDVDKLIELNGSALTSWNQTMIWW